MQYGFDYRHGEALENGVSMWWEDAGADVYPGRLQVKGMSEQKHIRMVHVED